MVVVSVSVIVVVVFVPVIAPREQREVRSESPEGANTTPRYKNHNLRSGAAAKLLSGANHPKGPVPPRGIQTTNCGAAKPRSL